jgi:hypothetical protein
MQGFERELGGICHVFVNLTIHCRNWVHSEEESLILGDQEQTKDLQKIIEQTWAMHALEFLLVELMKIQELKNQMMEETSNSFSKRIDGIEWKSCR